MSTLAEYQIFKNPLGLPSEPRVTENEISLAKQKQELDQEEKDHTKVKLKYLAPIGLLATTICSRQCYLDRVKTDHVAKYFDVDKERPTYNNEIYGIRSSKIIAKLCHSSKILLDEIEYRVENFPSEFWSIDKMFADPTKKDVPSQTYQYKEKSEFVKANLGIYLDYLEEVVGAKEDNYCFYQPTENQLKQLRAALQKKQYNEPGLHNLIVMLTNYNNVLELYQHNEEKVFQKFKLK